MIFSAASQPSIGSTILGWLVVFIVLMVICLSLYLLIKYRARRQRIREQQPQWKPDSQGISDYRWWDGSQFTKEMHGRAGIDPATGQKTAVQNGLTLCPIDSKKQYLNKASALTASEEIFQAKARQGQSDYTKNRVYHHYYGRSGQGCDCWHLTSQAKRSR